MTLKEKKQRAFLQTTIGVWLTLSFFIILSGGCLGKSSEPTAQQKKVRVVQMEQQKVDLPANLLTLPEKDYFNFSDELRYRMMDQLSDTPFRGLAIAAPKTIRLDVQQDFPLILLSQSSGQRDWEVNFKRNTMIIATNLSDGKIYVGQALSSPKKRDSEHSDKSMEGPPPSETDAEGITSDVQHLNVRSLLMIPWEPALYAITVVSYDLISNTVVVDLTAEKAHTTATDVFFPIGRALQFNEKAAGNGEPDELPTFTRTPHTPELKTEKLSFSVSKEIPLKAPAIPIYGHVKIAVPSFALVEPRAQKTDSPAAPEDKHNSATPTAVLTALVMVIRKDVRQPLRADFQIPIYSMKPVKLGEEVEGYFGIDLKSRLPEALPAANYQLYLVVGERIAGPFQMAVTDVSTIH